MNKRKNNKMLYVHDKSNSKPQEHNYVKKIAQMKEDGLIPAVGLYNMSIFHDDWCKIYSGSWCNCNPEIRITLLR